MVALKIGRKGDVDRYMLFAIVLLVLLVIALVLLYSGAYGFIENTFMEQLK
jgi:nitrate reductase NapE component